ncbi:MAG: lysylphosphatidylglycerol synthase transmembrane domain-containing protein [Legionellaceae bacterium]|nr:lysylphosphatidylglycerol synthase transmembrane domain-containing protein [Legionellaceae bacterium]
MVSLTILIIAGFSLGKTGLNTLCAHFLDLQWYWVVLLTLTAMFNHFTSSCRFFLIIKSYKNNSATLFDVVKINFAGLFLGYWMPVSIVGDGSRALWLKKYICDSYSQAIWMVIFDRLMSLIAILMFSIPFIPYYISYINNLHLWYWVIGLILVASLIAIYILMANQNDKIKKFVSYFDGIKHLFLNIKYYKSHFLVGMLYISSYFLLILFASFALNIKLNIWLLLAFTPLIFFVQNIPISFGGFGARELIFLMIFGDSIGKSSAVGLGLLVGFAIMLASLPGGMALSSKPNFLPDQSE